MTTQTAQQATYEDMQSVLQKRSLDNASESDKIIDNLVEQIVKYEARYGRTMTRASFSEGEGDLRTLSVGLSSHDEVVNGLITFVAAGSSFFDGYDFDSSLSGVIIKTPQIRAYFNFNSSDPKEQIEYEGLARIIQSLSEK